MAGQALALRAYFPASRPRLQRGRLSWDASITPASTTDTYQLHLEAVAAREAKIFVPDPPLLVDERGRLPHVYSDGSLCLNLRGQWRPHMLFTDTVVPWASQWLVFYELWLATGTWFGEGDEALDPQAQQLLLHEYTGPHGLGFAWLRDRADRPLGSQRPRLNR